MNGILSTAADIHDPRYIVRCASCLLSVFAHVTRAHAAAKCLYGPGEFTTLICDDCSNPIRVGQQIMHVHATGRRYHGVCIPKELNDPSRDDDYDILPSVTP